MHSFQRLVIETEERGAAPGPSRASEAAAPSHSPEGTDASEATSAKGTSAQETSPTEPPRPAVASGTPASAPLVRGALTPGVNQENSSRTGPRQQPAQRQQNPQDPDAIEHVAIAGSSEVVPLNKPEPIILRGTLPRYAHVRPIGRSKIPMHDNFQNIPNHSYPTLQSFVQEALDNAFKTIMEKGPTSQTSEELKKWKPSGFEEPCHFSRREFTREVDENWSEDRQLDPNKIAQDTEEVWYGRRSWHTDDWKGLPNPSIPYNDLRSYWKDNHIKNLRTFGSSVRKTTKIATYDCSELELVNWRDVTAEVCWIKHYNCFSRKRRMFAVLVLTASRALDPATLNNAEDDLPLYRDTADSRPEYNRPTVPPGESEAGSPSQAERPAPIGPTPAEGRPEGWIDSMFVVHLPLDPKGIPGEPEVKDRWYKKTLYPVYASVGMVRQNVRTQEEVDNNIPGKYQWWFALGLPPKPKTSLPSRWLYHLRLGVPHEIKHEPESTLWFLRIRHNTSQAN